jgi:haloalkane dehalogenase
MPWWVAAAVACEDRSVDFLRTPDDAFSDLPDWPFAPHYVTDGDDLRVAYVDEGPADGPVVLLMHGEPSWSYLYRFVIPPLVAAGCRVIAPDLVGFGRSDKPVERSAHTYQAHVDWMLAWLRSVDINNVTLFCQDWGGLIGLRLVTAEPDRFGCVIVSNTGLPTGEGKPTEAFLNWQRFSQTVEVFPVGVIVNGGSGRQFSAAEIAAYDAPFPTEEHKAGPRQLPSMVPTDPSDPAHETNKAAWEVLKQFTKPFVCAFSDGDAITKGGERAFMGVVPGTDGQPHTTLSGGHFIQEDDGPAIAELILSVLPRG